MASWGRTIVHADMDAFYAAVEIHDRPELRGKPVIVGYPGSRSVVTTASYEARRFGVGSAMSMEVALRRCPGALVIPPRFDRYEEVSRRLMEALASFTPLVEPLSLDEAFLDMSGSASLFGDPEEMGRRIKARVFEATGGLTVSVGIAQTKFVAKVASDHRKPDGLVVVPPGATRAFLDPLPLRRLWGVGPKAEKKLRRLGLRSIGDVAGASPQLLASALGSHGPHLLRLARGEDPRPVVPSRDPQSIGCENTLERDVVGADAIRPHLLRAADRVAERMRRHGVMARGVRVKLKTADFRILTRQTTLAQPTDSAGPLIEAATSLLPSFPLEEPFRLVGITGFDLAAAGAWGQQDLFAGGPGGSPARELDRAVDRVH
ncbi:MAG TPA: DNA polymerase IV, partial [Vulgatibacter sp.]|nr:DNA polymerase IV [Vulgatibacter sp.]